MRRVAEGKVVRGGDTLPLTPRNEKNKNKEKRRCGCQDGSLRLAGRVPSGGKPRALQAKRRSELSGPRAASGGCRGELGGWRHCVRPAACAANAAT